MLIFKILLLIISISLSLLAHQSKENYITIISQEKKITLQCRIESDNFYNIISLDDNNNNIISWSELQNHHKELISYILKHLIITQNKKYLHVNSSNFKVYRKQDQTYLSFTLVAPIQNSNNIRLKYDLFFDDDLLQRVFINFQEITKILTPHKRSITLDSMEPNLLQEFKNFYIEGIWHIWIGFDHLLFLLMLLLPAYLEKKDTKMIQVNSKKKILLHVLSIVTIFSLAHSITLSIAFLNIATLNPKIVESLIAISIVITAIFNLLDYIPKRSGIIIFIFGLLHGFGFANALSEIKMSNTDILMTILGFNLGVESGQILLLLASFPILFLLSRYWFYHLFIFKGISVLTLFIAILWFLERL